MRHFFREINRIFFVEGGSGGPLIFCMIVGCVILFVASLIGMFIPIN